MTTKIAFQSKKICIEDSIAQIKQIFPLLTISNHLFSSKKFFFKRSYLMALQWKALKRRFTSKFRQGIQQRSLNRRKTNTPTFIKLFGRKCVSSEFPSNEVYHLLQSFCKHTQVWIRQHDTQNNKKLSIVCALNISNNKFPVVKSRSTH